LVVDLSRATGSVLFFAAIGAHKTHSFIDQNQTGYQIFGLP
jgi:hypothetical protein